MIETSLKLFDEYGYHGVTVHEIVEQSGTSKGGFYHHFKSKDELLYVIHDYFISYVLLKANETIKTYSSPTDKLHNIIQSFVKAFDLYKPHITVFYQESKYLLPHHLESIDQKRDRYRDIILEVIQEGIDFGEFRKELSVSITGMSIIGMINWTYKWYKADGEKTIEEITCYFCDIIFHAIWTEEAKRNPAYEAYHC
ncbi:TetR/AcrR family transcriptional regulator [Bacillus massiliigorillae]|uniref:TetR/AcrR family transcriptional regulator n=1 Tax=Bacillus massiliigorillae TaxID=1243664 RepID=UPI0005AB11A4|nr:TetR/AcrR family transcriptional regulator [Bacillus massiliigorillae]